MSTFVLDPVAPTTTSRGRTTVAVERHLAEVLRAETRRWATLDTRFGELVETLADYVLAGGKRLRPAFCLLGHEGAGGGPDDPAVLDAAAGLEMLHAFALLHDDVMDGAETRRGRPAMHRRLADEHGAASRQGEARRFGEGLAVLIGDLAFAYADRLLSSTPPAARAVWNELRIELTMGQYLDVSGAASGEVDVATARRIAVYKSGRYTVTRPLHLGAALAGRLEDFAGHYTAFGEPLGEAFQLRDDVLGVFGDAEVTGKPVGDDLREGKPTVLVALARERATRSQARVLERIGDPTLDESAINKIREVITETGARSAVEQRIETGYEEAMAALVRSPVPDDVGRSLQALARSAVQRTS
jgi:geranylgeranyl diphosphate synthase type I